ncbi:hypothetical protein KUTeg_024645 [Tegillarca granosa]|uniref:Cadherin domain-containing protein n=1 Tax=Tegillarca granosa TaxID=220873 RepID=A0ABQ9DXV4_TEGGR|nr:hypothetical protein KUTeg_024645 [Tegillarca granosa]
MAKSQSTQNSIPSRTLNHIIPLLLLQFLVTFAQGQGPGNSETLRANLSIPENEPVGTYVGTIPTRQYHTFAFQESQPLFILNPFSGVITTKVQLDRESLTRNPLNILVIGTSNSTGSQYPIEIFITVLDVNDNAPSFPKPVVNISMFENVISQASLDTATDLDLAENGTVSSYKITSRTDNPDKKFEAIYNPELYGQFLIIRLIEKLDREEREFYQLQIGVTDQGHPQLNGSLTVNIFVKDNNDNQPVFGTSQYFTKINEGAPVGTSVTRVEATDRDTGPNGEISYSLIDDTNQFQIDKRTGEISTTATPLVCHSRCDRSASDFQCDSNSCILTIKAEDGGIPPNAGRTYVTVKIKDENDYAPKISIAYQPPGNTGFSTVNENAINGDVVAIVTVSDEDKGTFGNISSLDIIKGNEHGHFKFISRFNYRYNVLRVNGDNILDRERISMYNLTLKASDQGTPPKSSLTHLLIYVNDVNDHHPMFLKNEYRVSISETTPVGSFVLSLTATDLDSGENAELSYDILSGNELGWFQIDRFSGLLTVKSPIHFQTSSQLTLNISVHDGSLKPLFNYTKVIVTIWDENNIAPHFPKQNYNISVSENVPKGSTVVVLTALDEDSGANGSVVYEFHPEVEQLYQNMFQVDSQLGKITVQSNLDRETRSSYVLKLIARDQGQPSLSSTATLFISIADINDNKPKFYPREYYANILKNQPVGTSVITVSASDADIGSNAQVVYFWDGNFPDFTVDATSGLVTTTKSFDSTVTSPYVLKVKCTDENPVQEPVDTAVIYVKIINLNEVGPTFQNLPYLFSIIEDADSMPAVIGRAVGTVQATTPDLQTPITYSIIGGDSEQVFAINQNSGQITTRTKLDREVKQHYRLLVLANGGGKYSDIYVNVTVQDLNDNSPSFPMPTAEATVVENWSVGHEIFLASAVDLDEGVNADITYSLQFSSDLFDISVNTGMIFLKRPIEKSDSRNFNLNVLAQDSGRSRLSSSMLVHITILDVNDHAPVFSHNSYEISLNESISVNTQFYSLVATDADLGRNAEISYNITRGNFEGKFGIFPNGNLYVAHKLDREEKDHFHLAVMAKDNALEPRSTIVNVTIHVLDDNDNKPMFVNISYNFYVPENEPAGHILGSVAAVDRDIGRNAEVSYFLDADMDNFTIDTQTGELSTRKAFDRELLIENTGNSFYVFDAMVTDNGYNKLQNKVKITVHITDVNDNGPKFSQKNNIYKAIVKEDAAIYTRILKIVATDADIGENAALSYMISGGNDENKFDINAGNGQITLNGSLDREIQDSYVLQIMVTDSGKNRQYSSNCTVYISVIDVNDNQPLFAQSRFEIMVLETTTPEIVYSFSNQGNFQNFNIDKNTGRLYLLQTLDYERNRIYELVVLASDKGTPQLSSEAVVIIRVTDSNDNAPYFVNTSSNVSIRENIAAFTNIVKVTAVDPDSGINGKIVYDIKNQDPVDGHFSISTTGQIYVSNAATIDREMVSLYSLTIIARDSSSPVSSRKTIEKVITINVIDENDNAPYFVSSDAIIIDYPSQQGHVATIEADDNDAGNNGLIVYELTNGDRSLFSLESATGKLFLRNNIPQAPVSYTITVTASDRGTSPQSTRMDFMIILLPKSGSRPTFLNVPYSRQIRENEKAGTSVLQVQATPVVQNSPLEYYITSVIAEISKKGRYLEINSQSGVISTFEILDRELLGSYLNVTVCVLERSTNDPRAKTEHVKITILDENDTPPKFSKGLYVSNIPENGGIGATVAQVLVTDSDITGQVTLGILSYIITGKSLNREERKEYELIIGASDGINSAQTMVQILVQDLNDNPPKFSRAIYSFDLPENTVKGTTLGRVEAIDVDEGASGEVNYTLYPLYTLTVSAQDHGNPSLSSTAIVYMNIKDINDNTPVFDLGSYSAEVMESVTVGTSVLTVSASDRDSGNYSFHKH